MRPDQFVQMTNPSVAPGAELSPPDRNLPAPDSTSSKAMYVCLWGAGRGHGVARLGVLGAQKRAFFPSPASAPVPLVTYFGGGSHFDHSGCQQQEETQKVAETGGVGVGRCPQGPQQLSLHPQPTWHSDKWEFRRWTCPILGPCPPLGTLRSPSFIT